MELREIKNTNYLISDCGRVFSSKGKEQTSWEESNSKYLLVRLTINGKPTCKRVHRLVAETWIPNPEKLPYVKHKDDDKSKNSVDNLSWGTNPQNTQEGYDNGCYKFKTRSYKVEVTDKVTGHSQVFKSIRSLCSTLNLNRKNVSAILNNNKVNNYKYEFSYLMPND